MKLQNLLSRADVTRTDSYTFEDPDDKIVKFPETPEAILADRRKYERLMVDARGDLDQVLTQYNSLVDLYNAAGQRASDVLKAEYGLVAHPTLKPKIDLAGPEAHGTAPPNLPKEYKEVLE